MTSKREPKQTKEYLLGIVRQACRKHEAEIAQGHALPGDQKGDVSAVLMSTRP